MSERKPNRPNEEPAKETLPTGSSGQWKTVFDPNTRILEIQLTGVIDLSTLQAMATSVGAEADIANPLGILADYSSATLELGFDEIFGLPERAPEFGIKADFPVAVVFNDLSQEQASFAEDVFSNRGYVYKAFRHKESAAMWLLEMARTGATSWTQA